MNSDKTVGERLVSVMKALDVEQAHIAFGFASEQVYDLLRLKPNAAASLTAILSPRILDASVVAPLAQRLLCISGRPMSAAMRRNYDLICSWSGTQIVDLPESYRAEPWSDVVKDFTDLTVASLLGVQVKNSLPALRHTQHEGEVAGIAYKVEGSGPPLLLFPIGIAPTQWDAALPELNKAFTTIRLGGEHIGFVQLLEERARAGTYRESVRSLLDLMQIQPGERVLEVGCGSGALVRDLAVRTQGNNAIVAVDINEYLLNEARALARGLPEAGAIDFRHGSAESLPFPDGSFDAAFAITVLEECNADTAISEMRRVLRPGGRAAVLTRSADLPVFWNLELPPEVLRKINAAMPQQVSDGGCVDAGLYSIFGNHFQDVKPHPVMASFPQPLPTSFAQARALLNTEELSMFESAVQKAAQNRTLFASIPFHSVAGTRR